MALASSPQRVRLTGTIRSHHESTQPDGSWQKGVLETLDHEAYSYVASGLPFMPVGCRVEVSGIREIHPHYGDQLRLLECHRLELPVTESGLERFLEANVPGMGKARAKRVVSRLGTRAIERLDADPRTLERLFPGKRGRELAAAWETWRKDWQRRREAADLELQLVSAGATPTAARQVVSYFRGPEVVEIILRRHPYRLLDVPGFGWKRADALARKIGVPPDSSERLRAAARHALEKASDEGHSALPHQEAIQRASGLLEDQERAERGLEGATEEGLVIEDGGLFYLPSSLEAEWTVSSCLTRHIQMPHGLTEAQKAAIDGVLAEAGTTAEQSSAIRSALGEGAFVLTGGPGTGKTTTLQTLLRCARELGLDARVVAPTGKASARATEITGVEAETIHRFIGGPPGERLEVLPDVDLLVVDEASMVSLEVFAWLLSNIPPEARLVLVGDADQLPSVGHGSVLRDLLESETVPSVRLERVLRQATESGVVDNAHRVLRGQDLRANQADFLVAHVDERSDGGTPPALEWQRERARERLLGALEWLRGSLGADLATDVQVLTPVKRGPLGVEGLNEAVQGVANPEGALGPWIGGGHRVRVGDRVMQVRNDYALGEGVFNGEQGLVLAAGPDWVTVRWDGGQEVDVMGFRLFNLHLAWAVTVHRAQGSEWPHVVTVYHSSHGRMLVPELLYTAITRASEGFVHIGDRAAYRETRRRVGESVSQRFTGLPHHLQAHLTAGRR